MSLFEDLKPFMDAQVDAGLGDSITYKINGVPVEQADAPGVTTIPAFLIDLVDDGGGFGAGGTVQAGQLRWQLKIKKDLLPERPSMKHRVTSPLLDGPYRPVGNNPTDGGAYWIADLQKAPA